MVRFVGVATVAALAVGCSTMGGPGDDGRVTPSGPAQPPRTSSPEDNPVVSWRPRVGDAWQWQLSGELDLSIDVPIYDVDWMTTSADTVAELHDLGRHVICYLSVGTWESYREDADAFPEEVRGKTLADYPDERWLDVRRLDVLAPLLSARLDVCRDKGFDAVEPDNVDAYQNDSGFPLTSADQLSFNRWVAKAAHDRGMSVGLKNDLGQVRQLVDDFDFAINEQCFEYDECDVLIPFIEAGKAVLHVEYQHPLASFCPGTTALGFSSMRKRFELGAYREACPGS